MKLLIFLICLAYHFARNTSSTCIPKTSLPQLYSTDISIAKFNKDSWNKPLIRFNYIQNIPLQFLRQSKAWELNSLLTLDSFQWSGMNRAIRFMPSKYSSQTAILITFQSESIIWEYFNFKLLINDYKYRPQIYLGELVQTVQFANTNKIEMEALFPKGKTYTNSVKFISGLHAKAIGLAGEQYDISVSSKIENSTKIKFTIQVGKSTSLQKIFISYAVYNISLSEQFQIVSGSFIFGATSSGELFNKIDNCLPINQGYILGLSAIKMKQAYNAFGLSLKTVAPNLLRAQAMTSIQFLEVSYLGIGVTVSEVCGSCQTEKFVYADQDSISCLPKCPSNAQVITDKNKSVCSKCQAKLDMELRNGICSCRSGFKEYNGRCIRESQYQKYLASVTYSVSENTCLQPNMILKDSQCVCKEGFRKSSQGNCMNECQNGFWDGKCVYCNVNQFPYQELKQCRSCSTHCAFCQSINVCAFCQSYFFNNQNGGCSQICGDGFRIEHECDDGNTDNSDGCSSTCKIEEGFNCSGGSPQGSDVCKQISYTYSLLNQKSVANGYLVQYHVNPVPTLFSNQELKDKVKVEILKNKEIYSYPYQVYAAQDFSDPSFLQIFISFIDFPTQNLEITFYFRLGQGPAVKLSVTALFFQFNSFASTRLDNTNLT